ncbi:acylphosphatase [Raineyella sp. LH-20]|uniref:acylphosphatase n=1 Tax=Raineyella sp. LH-20 TaxID=3081204 RepID=UPI002953F6F2|nr:acylphosphatase [Raineyella sp. LH-20]WOP18130.1 acylphosphatase [Raineyella sp. LH-20]
MRERPLEELHAVVHGHVQGVGFRFWTERQAARIGLVGWVANRPNGTVEIIAQGTHAQVIELLRTLKSSMTPGQVERLEREIRTPTVRYEDFGITY